jgi:anti-sigma factor RsiW
MSDRELLRALLGPADPEVTCEACFERLDAYVEGELAGRDAEAVVPGMRAHLEGCPACAADHDSLLAFVSAERARARVDRG